MKILFTNHKLKMMKSRFLLFLFFVVSAVQLLSQDAAIAIEFTVPEPLCVTDSMACTASLSYPFVVSADYPEGLSIHYQIQQDSAMATNDSLGQITGTYPDYQLVGSYPIGTYTVVLEIQDSAGNMLGFMLPFSVVDCQSPSIDCLAGLAVQLLPVQQDTDADGDGDYDDGAMAVWAIDFISSASDACSPEITYSIHRQSEAPNPDQPAIVVTCDDPETTIVRIYAWDSAYNPYAIQPDGTMGGPNYASCEVYILVQASLFSPCNCCYYDLTVIAGVIATEETIGIEGVEVILSGDMDQIETTDAGGAFTFTNLYGGDDYLVTPYYNVGPSNGVSAYDLLLMHRHITGVHKLDSPYKMIAGRHQQLWSYFHLRYDPVKEGHSRHL